MPDLTQSWLNLRDVELAAEEGLDPGVFAYFAQGAADEQTLADNRAAFARWRILPRVLRGLRDRSTATTVLGTPVAMPILVAPLAYQGLAHAEGDVAIARAAAAAGTLQCLSTLSNHRLEDVAAATPGAPRWFQLYPYRDDGVNREVIARAAAAGFDALVVTVDTVVYARRERELRHRVAFPPELGLPNAPVPAGHLGPGTPGAVNALMDPGLDWADLERFAALADLPVLPKGVLHPADARLAVEHGAAGILVSNQGGRQLDGVPAALDALPAIAEEVAGEVELYLDGGVRRGTDVLKALALGARAVLVGRPVAYGLAVAGEAGVRAVLGMLADELATALGLSGCATVQDVQRGLVHRTEGGA